MWSVLVDSGRLKDVRIDWGGEEVSIVG